MAMTLVTGVTKTPTPGRPKGSTGNGRSSRETIAREKRKFDVEKAAAELNVARKVLAEKARRADPLDPLKKAVLYSTLVLALLILIASAIFSFATIAAVAEWMRPPLPFMVWLVPVAIEFFIVFFGMDSIISQARGDKKGARFAFVGMLVATSVAVIANAAHTVAESPDMADWRAWVGVFLSALIPVGTLLAAKRAIRLVFRQG
jgi:uncharacterized membrane protein YcjF (UPF0283 family)